MEEILQQAYFQVVEEQNSLSSFFDLKKEAELCFLAEISGLQDSYRIRRVYRSMKIAEMLINEAGELDLVLWKELLHLFKEKEYIFCPGGENDGTITQRQISILHQLPELFKLIKKFQRPLCHVEAEGLVRDHLQLPSKTMITNAHIRRSVFSACLTSLRQNVGSCFATAPAILIQEEQVERLILDLYDLLSTGKLKRVIAGTEFSAPLSPSWGWGDLRKKIDLGKIEFCPGFLLALTRVGVLESALSWGKKVEKAAAFSEPFKGKGYTIEALLRAILTGHFGVKIEEKEKEARSAFRSFSDHPLLKAWEFTLASFSEAKMEFSRWNLYVSLGLHQEEKGGIGEVLYRYVNSKLEESNQKVQEHHIEYETAFNQVKVVEALLRNAGSEAEARRLRAEYQARYYHMQASLDLRDKAYTAATKYSSLYAFIVKQYDEKFPEYFQEIYDAEMMEVISQEIYDDAPAGFRLVYKHGRSDASSWSFIYDQQQFVDALIDFFRMTEGLISAAYGWEEGDPIIQEATTQVILHVRSKEFIESAIQRRDKPWAYISGGSLSHLLKIYYKRESDFIEEERWVESEQELLIFFLDSLKNLPPFVLEEKRKMLMHSPTHACIFDPFQELFFKGWNEGGFTYTWVRDEVVEPRKSFYEPMMLSPQEQQFLIEQFAQRLTPLLAHQLQKEILYIEGACSVSDFREKMKHNTLITEWDGFLYNSLPLLPSEKYYEALKELCTHPRIGKVLEQIPFPSFPWVTKKSLLSSIKACYLLAEKTALFSYDLHSAVIKRAIEKGYAPPAPLIFADTNWPNFFFAFLVNPGTLSLELWRTDSTGSYGLPMTDWKRYVNGKEKKTWGILTRPQQYK